MSDLEKRDRLAEPIEADTGGECFIAFKLGDGTVHTLSGMADSIHFETDRDEWIDDNFVLHTILHGGIDVTIHFTDRIIQETRPFDGKEETR